MKIAKLNCPIISEALKDRKTFQMLNVYLESFVRTEDKCFLSRMVPCGDALTLNFKLAIKDYLFNEGDGEAKALWKLAEKLTGKESIHWTIIKTVEL